MRPSNIFLTIFLLSILSSNLWAKEYKITDFGAVADTNILSTQAIQKAIDLCSENGGGQVIIPAGNYKTGTIILKSNVNFHLENGAVLYGSKSLNDYIKLKPEYISLRTQEATIQLIYAESVENVSITGFGEINGQGSGFKKLSWNDEGITRPHLIRFITSKNVTIENISLKNSGCWMQHYLACEKLQIRGVRVFNRNNYNNDALDLDGCRNVTVSDFISDSDDDGITLKSTSPKPCENIAITNCVISSRCNAIKLGTESNGGFKNISISNCVVKPSEIAEPAFFGNKNGASAIALEIVDGGIMEGISVSNIQVDGTEAPIFIRLGNRARSYQKDVVIDHIGTLGNIGMSNIRIKNAGKIGSSITGLPGFPVTNIRLSNIVMDSEGGGTLDDLKKEVEEKPKDYPDGNMFGTLPASGFYIRHAAQIDFDGVQISSSDRDLRPALYLDDVSQSNFSNLQIQSNEGNSANIWLKNSRDIVFKESVIMGKSTCFVKLNRVKNSNISILNNVLSDVTNSVLPKKNSKGCITLK
ncbi:MAG TPA: glycosyl hydrolase family 28 protein [Prolixibacteraceae bacterium]|nr:glycosyl hydrolase family 28 protein [Prolixibacteraceae bacterium]